VNRLEMMCINGSIQPRTTYVAPVEFGLRTGETVILVPEQGAAHSRLLALVESAVATGRENQRNVAGVIQVLAAISDDGSLSLITSVPTFFADAEPITAGVGRAYYGSVDVATDPVTKQGVQPAALVVGDLLTDAAISVVVNASGFNRHTAMLAQSGAGKSYALGVILEELIEKTAARLVVLDPNGDFAHLGDFAGDKNVIVAEGRDPKMYRSATRRLTQRKVRGAVLNLNTVDPVLWDGLVGDVLNLLWERRDEQRPTIIVVDEAHNFVPAESSNNNVARALMRIAAEGRKYGLWLVLASQRPQKLHSNVISQCDNLILMRLTSQIDLDHIASAFGAVDRTMMQLATGFRSGSAMVVGRLVKSPTLLRFRARRLPEAGGDIELSWACGIP
jgi:DNA helicase HerA-like ATPase